jgi:hypothetical protein
VLSRPPHHAISRTSIKSRVFHLQRNQNHQPKTIAISAIMPKNKKRHDSDGEDEVISPVVKKAKVKTPSKASTPSKPTSPPAKGTEKRNSDKKNTDAEGNEFWEVGFLFFLFLSLSVSIC